MNLDRLATLDMPEPLAWNWSVVPRVGMLLTDKQAASWLQTGSAVISKNAQLDLENYIHGDTWMSNTRWGSDTILIFTTYLFTGLNQRIILTLSFNVLDQ